MGCPAATKLGRSSVSGQQTVALTNASTLLVPYSEGRISLVISGPALNLIWLSLRQAAAAQQGIAMPTTAGPLALNIGDHGALVQGPIFGIAPTAPESITYWDTSVGSVE